MIKNDARYIIRRVIVYFAIFFIFSIISSCNVHAQDTYTVNGVYSWYTNSIIDVSFTRPYNELEYIMTTDETKYKNVVNSNMNYGKSYINSYFSKLANGDFNNYLNQYDSYAIFGNNSYNGTGIYFFNKEDIHFYKYNDNSLSEANNPLHGDYSLILMSGVRYNGYNNSYSNFTKFYTNTYGGNGYGAYNGQFTIRHDSFTFHTMYVSSQDVIDSALGDTPIENPTLNLIVNKTVNDNIVTNYNFELDYSVFDTDNFKYYYKIGDNQRLQVLENNVSFNVNQNNTIYFTIYNNNDELIYSESFTITNLYQYDIDTDNFNIQYESKNSSVSEENSTSTYKSINNVTIDFEYFPKRSIYKYQYQFVESEQSLGTWLNLGENEYEKGYTTNVNGTMYNRILDSEDNILYSSTFNVNSIGKTMIDDNVSWYNSLFGKINYGNGISTIFFIPVRLIETIKNSFNNTCTNFNMGTILGKSLVLKCIDIESIIGSNLYHIIDLIFMGFIVISLCKFIVSVYNRIVSLKFEGNDDGNGVLFL